MPSLKSGYAPNLGVFLNSLETAPVESSIENLISLLKRRQVRNSRLCAVATAHLLHRVVENFEWTDIGKLLERIQQVGRRLIEAQPKQLVVGNIVRRVLGMIRDEAKEDRTEDISDYASNSHVGSPKREQNDVPVLKLEGAHPAFSSLRFGSTNTSDLTESNGDDDVVGSNPQVGSRPPLLTSHTSYAVLNGIPVQQSMFNLLSATPSPSSTPPGTNSPYGKSAVNAASLANRIATTSTDLKAEVISGVKEIIDELDQVDDQIAGYAQEHIHSNEVILTHSSSLSVQRFLLKAAKNGTFTVIVAESYPNDHEATHASVTGKNRQHLGSGDGKDSESFLKPLSAAGITVVLIPDAALFATMPMVGKVILSCDTILANGGLIAAAGANIIARAAKVHGKPVVVVGGAFKLSPAPAEAIDPTSLIEYGDPGTIIGYDKGYLMDKVEVDNPLNDYIPPDLVDLYITNLGAHSPSYLYRIVADHYKPEDIKL